LGSASFSESRNNGSAPAAMIAQPAPTLENDEEIQ